MITDEEADLLVAWLRGELCIDFWDIAAQGFVIGDTLVRLIRYDPKWYPGNENN